MRSTVTILSVVLLLGASPALAFPRPAAYPIPHVLESPVKEPSHPYARNYTDEMAQSLGFRDGRWEVFDVGSRHPLMPSLKGGIDGGGPMLRLQWRQ